MTGAVVSITTVWFWAVAVLAVVAMRLTADSRWREHVFAGINLLALSALLREAVFAVLCGLVVIRLLLLMTAEQRTRRVALIIVSALLLGGFVFHKTAHGNTLVASPATASIMVAVGFSYVVLRLVEVSRAVGEGRHPVPTLVGLVNYLVPFHMLAAGPIQAYDDFVAQSPNPKPLDAQTALEALDRIARGVFKKVVLAFAIQKVFLTDFTGGVTYGIVEAQFALLWLYLDFSAYSDIAVGLGIAMGIRTPENFERPFRSRNLMEFWDRWHITLSLFIRRNLFFPIQIALVRRSRTPHPLLFAALATAVSFTLAGLWHGIDRGWLAWGLLHAGGLVVVRLWAYALQRRLSPSQLDRYRNSAAVRIVATIATFEYVALAFVPVFVFNAKT